jgi:hypothetical protein
MLLTLFLATLFSFQTVPDSVFDQNDTIAAFISNAGTGGQLGEFCANSVCFEFILNTVRLFQERVLRHFFSSRQ